MAAYYNEFDPYAAQWLRNLIAAGHIAPGDVDNRSILDVRPDDLAGYTQCHFFAGIGVWSHALRLAGWPDDRPVWTGSCPCQPFSVAGVGNGFNDERHLWPFWFHLIEQRRPPVVFGEQVEAAIRHGWLDLVQADLEGSGYAFAAAGIPAAGVGAPHIRQRLWFVADADQKQRGWWPDSQLHTHGQAPRWNQSDGIAEPDSEACQLADTLPAGRPERGPGAGGGPATGCREFGGVDHHHQGLEGREFGPTGQAESLQSERYGSCGLADAFDSTRHGSQPRAIIGEFPQGVGALQTESAASSPTNGHWRDADWLYCRDGKWRPVEPGTSPLAHGAPARVGRLRAYGNAIVPQVAAEVIGAYMECRP